MQRLRRARASAFVVALALLVPVFASPPPVAAETLGYFDIYGSTAIDVGRDVTTDAAGNIYVLGETNAALPGCDPACTNAGNLDLFVRKYAPDGTVAWTRELGSTAKEMPSAIGLDGSGNVYASGKVAFDQGAGALPGQTQIGTQNDGFLVKYSPSGTLLWVRQFGLTFASATVSTDAPGLAVDSTGNAYVAGESFDVDSTADVGYVRKYDSSGSVLWEQRFAALTWETDYDFPMPHDLALSPSGSVVAVSGETYGTLVSGYTNPSIGADAFVATFAASDGTPGWIKQWGTSQSDAALAVAIDSQGSVVATSTVGTSAVASSIRQFDSTGSLLWTGSLATLAGRPPQTTGRDIAIGPSDQIAVAGEASVGGLYPAIWLFASDGTAGWSAMPADISLYSGVAYGPGGLLYATGDYRASELAKNDMVLVRVGPTDTSAPTVSLAQAESQADPTTVGPVNFSLVADEALDKTTVTAADFSITNGTIGTIACSGFLATTCTIPVTPTADGVVTIEPSASFSVADPSGNTQTSAGGTDRTVTYDGTAPTLTLAQAAGQADPASVSPVNFSLIANEVLDEATITATDFDVTGGTLGTIACSGTPTTCTLPVNVTADGIVTLAPSAGFSVADLVGNTQTTADGTDRTVVYAATIPANDSFASPTTLARLSGSIEGTTVNATIEEGEDQWTASTNSVWYEWTNTSRKDLVVTFAVSGCDTQITAIATSGPPAWTERNIIADSWSLVECTTGGTISFVATAGATYTIRAAVYYRTGEVAPFTLSWTTSSVIRGSLAITLTNTRGEPTSCTLTVKGTNLLASQTLRVWSFDDPTEGLIDEVGFTTEAGRWSPLTVQVADTDWSIESSYRIGTDPNALLSADGASPVIPKIVNRCRS